MADHRAKNVLPHPGNDGASMMTPARSPVASICGSTAFASSTKSSFSRARLRSHQHDGMRCVHVVVNDVSPSRCSGQALNAPHGKCVLWARLPVGQKVINQFPDPTTAVISPRPWPSGRRKRRTGAAAPPYRAAGLRHDDAGVAYRSRAHDRDGGDWRLRATVHCAGPVLCPRGCRGGARPNACGVWRDRVVAH